MPRVQRVDVGGEVYHVLNRANARVQIFDNDEDYQQFEQILEEAIDKFEMKLLAYCVIPNHWHLVLHPKVDGDMQKFRHKVHKTVPKMIFICLYVAIKHQLLNFMIKKTSEMSIL
jgi:REP element-mobilizing transposase RayT